MENEPTKILSPVETTGALSNKHASATPWGLWTYYADLIPALKGRVAQRKENTLAVCAASGGLLGCHPERSEAESKDL